jgi:hypothetical protein
VLFDMPPPLIQCEGIIPKYEVVYERLPSGSTDGSRER